LGRKHPESVKKKIADAHKGRKATAEAVEQARGVKRPGATSRFVGVSWHEGKKRWVAKISVNGKRYQIGAYLTEIEAAIAYNAEAQLKLPPYTRLNQIDGVIL
jgi:hypothetical protein